MMPKSKDRPRLQLEALESRTLLAGDMAAITSSGAFVTNFDSEFVGNEVAIASTVGGNLVIDAALLPNSVTDLRISGFESVTINGADQFNELNISKVGSFSAAEIDVSGTLKVRDVDSLKLHSLAGVAWFYGDQMRLEVFDAGSVTIMSALERLTISTQNKLSLLGNTNQEVVLEFRIDQSGILLPNVIAPPDEAPPTLPGSGGSGGTPDRAPTYVVIIIVSKSSPAAANFSLLKLQDALERGDVKLIKSAFADYLQTIRPSDQQAAYAAALANASGAANPELSGLTFPENELFAATSLDEPTRPTFSPDLYSGIGVADLAASIVRVATLPESVSAEVEFGQAAETALSLSPFAISSLTTNATRNTTTEQSPSRESPNVVIDAVRASLAGLVADVNAGTQTVSAYIIDEVGDKFGPGVLPGLLVEPKSSRVRRDAVEWIQV